MFVIRIFKKNCTLSSHQKFRTVELGILSQSGSSRNCVSEYRQSESGGKGHAGMKR